MTLRSPRILVLLLACLPSVCRAADNDARPGFTPIDSVAQLRQSMATSGARVRMKPGVYSVTDTDADKKHLFIVTGSDCYFDLRGVTLEVDTQVLANMHGKVHEPGGCWVTGDRVTFEGATFEDIGDHPPRKSMSEFNIRGDDVKVLNCRFIIRGSAPYGYGDIFGKGSGSVVDLQKHAAMGIDGDRALIDGCYFRIHTFGHGIHMHGAQDTVIRNVTVEGDLRPTEELYAEKGGIVAQFDYKRSFPEWAKGTPIPHNQMLSLTEDGIRAYSDGVDRNGRKRHTGFITVENCVVRKMRGGITLAMATGAKVTGCTVIDCGADAYALPSNAVVRDCRGNAAYSPLLRLPYAAKRDADIELQLLDAAEELGDHPLALITGSGHRVKITPAGDQPPRTPRPIIIGSAGERYADESDAKTGPSDNRSSKVTLENLTLHPVQLTKDASDCRVTSRSPVEDQGKGNTVLKPR